MQRLSPTHLQGRPFSALDVLVGFPQTVSIVLGAGLVTVLDFRLLIAVLAAVVLLAAGYLATRPERGLRTIGDGSSGSGGSVDGQVVGPRPWSS